MCIFVFCAVSKLKLFGLPGEKKKRKLPAMDSSQHNEYSFYLETYHPAFVALRYLRGSWFVVSEAFTKNTFKKKQQCGPVPQIKHQASLLSGLNSSQTACALTM